jgi:Domain of unknown function (4846)
MRRIIALLPLVISVACGETTKNKTAAKSSEEKIRPKTDPITIGSIKTISEIPVPPGYHRLQSDDTSFSSWLRAIPLKKDKTVYLYSGQPKANQTAQYAVVDIPRSSKDLMQCADVVMKLRAEYLFSTKNYQAIAFTDYAGKEYKWTGKDNRQQFNNYLDNVFGWCGSASLEKQLKPVADIHELQAGDVFIKGGFPGHAMIVTDVAVNNKGDKIFLLVQGYQPAQDMHVVVNPMDSELSPWYKITEADEIRTPEWIFYKNQLKRW